MVVCLRQYAIAYLLKLIDTILAIFLLLGKARRIKQAREEAQAEIERYRQERDRLFKEYEAKYMGSKEDVAARIDKKAQILIQDLHKEVENNKEQVKFINFLILY